MEIRLQFFDGCPSWRVTESRLAEALERLGHPAHRLVHERIETPQQADDRRFPGSPTILVDGRDPFAEAAAPAGLACRIYRTEAGPEGAPSVMQLAAALGEVAAHPARLDREARAGR